MARICQRCSHHNEDHAKFCLSCGAMLEVDADENAGDPLIGRVLLGRYRPVSVLGEGGMGKVYEAEQKMGTATRKVAIKTLHPELSGDPQLVARFHRESETVIELRHPNTIQFYDFGELDDGTLIIVMEYIKGKPLSDVGAIDAARADKIIIQICGSLHEAHQRGIVHRDLKPDNVLLTNQGGQSDFVKVLDFGIAKKDDAEDANQAKLTKQGMVLGTPPYMSPEQFSGQVLDARSDVYSLGIMVYEMLTGQLPFEASTPWEWATKHLTAEPHPIDAHPAGAALAQNKKNAIMRALAKNRDERQEGVLAFLQEFTGYEDANSAWTMATSAGGPVVAGAGQARGPAPTPGPMPQTAAGFAQNPTPPPGYGSAPGVSNPGYSQPGMAPAHSAPGMPPNSFGGMGSAPGYPPSQVPGAPSQHGGYASYAQPAPSSGGTMGKLLFVGVIGLFILGGAGGGLAWWAFQSDDDESHADTTTTTPTPPTNPPVAGGMQPLQPNNTGVPTTPTPMQPLQPNTPTTPTTPTPDTPTTPEPPTTPPETTPERPTRPTRPRGPSAADEARARALVANGLGAAQRNDFRGAVAALQGAQRAVGRRHPSTQQLRSELQRRGSNQVGILLQQGRCGQAQALYRQLNSVGAGSDARRQFGDWCPAR